VTLFRPTALTALSLVVAALALTTCRGEQGPKQPTEPPQSAATLAPPAPPGSVILVGAGDISSCTHPNDTSTAKLLDAIPGTVFTTGENVMPSGASTDYTTCYDPTWGRQKARTFPAPGEVDYKTTNASGYFGYFGANAGDPTKGYYSYGLGAWHIVVLNSSLSTAAGSAQEQWLKADLAANPSQCTLAYWHYPMFYSGTSTVRSWLQPLWNDLYAAGAAVVLNSHTRNYERFAPQTPAGVLDTAQGIREFVVGTGGLGRWSFYTIAPNSEVRAMVYGVLQLTLSPGRYSWQFISIPGQQFSDSGSGTCHGPTPAPQAPTAVPGGPYSGSEGTALSFDGSGSSDPAAAPPLTYAWTFGDGTSGTGAKPTHAYLSSGSFTVTLTVTNARGTASAPATTTATVANVAPTVNAGPAQSVTAGSPLTLNASFTDPGTDGPWSYTITWGDGSAATTGSATSQASPITATHTYAAAGTNTVQVAVTDKGGATGTGQLIVTVTPAPPPVAAPGGPYAGTEGTAVGFDGSGSSDPAAAPPLTYAWTFGDGTSGTGAKPTHAYLSSGSFTVTLTVTNARGTVSAPATTTATVANVAPTVNAGPAQSVTAGSLLTLNASFTDPGTDGPWSYTITWGDGSPVTTGSATSQASPISATHTYAAAGTNTVQVAVTDKGGATGTGQLLVTVTQPLAGVTFVGAGDIAECELPNDEATAQILDTIPGTVFALGDNAYPNGTLANYQTCYGPSWGRHKYRTYPAPGNHDFDSSATAAGYFSYFGAVAGTPGQGYYSFDLGAWHIIVLNSSNAFVSTAVGSPQEQWLKADLAASTKKCQLAMFHHPRYYSTTSSAFYPTGSVKPFWDDLYAAGAELIINGHMHDYERFAPQTPAGVPDSAHGIREIIVGTGGGGLDRPNTLFQPTSQAYITGVYGVLRLTLGDGWYSWQFIPVAGQTATDSGTGSCH
jgi:PKD repeat protein